MDARTNPKIVHELQYGESPKTTRRVPVRRMLFIGLLLAAALASSMYGYYWWTTGRYLQSTDDAYVGGNITPIAPHISGFVAEIAVTDNQEVKAGQLLVRLDDRDVRAAADHAEAVLKQREATLESLRAKNLLQQSTIEQASADVDAKTAQADFAKADAERYRLLAQTNSGSQQNAQRADSIDQAARGAHFGSSRTRCGQSAVKRVECGYRSSGRRGCTGESRSQHGAAQSRLRRDLLAY